MLAPDCSGGIAALCNSAKSSIRSQDLSCLSAVLQQEGFPRAGWWPPSITLYELVEG
jgi:hypothetical protein